MELGLDSIMKWDDSNGDTYDPFWAYDDSLYAFGCDGRGFKAKSKHTNLNFNKLSGQDFYHLVGSSVNPMYEYGTAGQMRTDSANWKVCGQECIDSVFYAFVSRNKYGHKSHDPLMRQASDNASLIKSYDNGLTWLRTEDQNYSQPLWPGKDFGAPCFIHFGKNGGNTHRDKSDKYVYAISNNGFWNGGDYLVLGRVERKKLPQLNPADWKYFHSGNGNKKKNWDSDVHLAHHLLDLPAHLGQTGATYIPALKQYILVAWYITDTLKKWFTPTEIRYDFYMSPHPWGNWNLVKSYSDHFMDNGHWYGPAIMSKFQEKIGNQVRLFLVTSGCPPFKDTMTSLYKMWGMPIYITPSTNVQTDTMYQFTENPSIITKGKGWKNTIKKLYKKEHNCYQSSTKNDSLLITFSGNGIELLCSKAEGNGAFDVYLDQQFQAHISLTPTHHFPSIHTIPVWKKRHLKKVNHQLLIVHTDELPIVFNAMVLEKK